MLGSGIFGLFVPISKSMIIDYNSLMPFFGNSSISSIPISIAINFGIISLLQLAYWYGKCSLSSSKFGLKENELREKLTGFVKAFNESSNNLTSKLKIRNDIDDCVSELMFGGLALNSGKPISFDGIHDFSTTDIPCEVKTIHDEIIVTKNEYGQTVIGSKKEEFGELSLKREMV